MVQSIFIAYAHEDEALAIRVRDSLARIQEFEPYLAVDYPSPGENFKDRIMNAIENCRFFIVFLTENGLKSQWVNQELGYACGVKKRKRNYRIIPISKNGLPLKGFITKDSEDLLMMDKFDFDYIIANIFIQIRYSIPSSLREGGLNVEFSCPSCKDHVGLPLQMYGKLPAHQDYLRALNSVKIGWGYTCTKCHRQIVLKLTTFEQIKLESHIRDAFSERPFRRDPFEPR